MGDWTPEPWAMYVGQPPWVRSSDGSLIAAAHDGDCEANARRIVACVNALEGWTTEALEQLAAPIASQLRERDERIRKLEGMLKVYASGHHDDTHVGRGAEDYTDCPEQICIDACDALGYALGEG